MDTPTLSILTPAEPGAIGVLLLSAPDGASLEAAGARIGLRVPAVGGVRLAMIAGVDQGVVARVDARTLHLMPHAGVAVVEGIVRRVRETGIRVVRANEVETRVLYPEATDEVEARMLWALSQAVSPLAIDLLLDQPRRWRVAGASSDASRDRVLRRLIDPATVVAVGPPNVGKSTLCNALAGRSVSIVADEAGTTRDHVGVMIEVGGLVVRYVDTPGMTGVGARKGSGVDEAEAVAISRRVLESADLVLRCGDGTAVPLELRAAVRPAAGVITIGLRTDLATPGFASDIEVSAASGTGMGELSQMIRERLVPQAAVLADGAWKFWD